jgi:phenylpropionate dioxygenase-like ring-hydroxylating dioxygenase large terminal subunit
MKALISPSEYCSKEILKLEYQKIFNTIWNYVGTTDDFSHHNDFVATFIDELPIVIQNVKGTIKAFKNVCSHRHSIIQTVSQGNRMLMCPYHGWAYNENGIPIGIPKKPLFKFSEEELECLKLKEYKVEICGKLVFININNDSISLKDYLGKNVFSEVELLSNNFGELVDTNEMAIDANWKILVENTLESYHVNLIHSNTFLKLGTSGMEFEFDGYHSTWNAGLKVSENEGNQEKVHRPYQGRDYKINGYKHVLLFPNVLISTTYGISFNLSLITPINENSSKFRSFVFVTKLNRELEGKSAMEKIYSSALVDFNRQVFVEDKVICEKVQIGVKQSHHGGELSDEEERVCEFQKVYRKFMDK